MLVLTRKKDETVVLRMMDGTCVNIKITDIRGNHVRVGVDAPKSVSVDRGEVDLERNGAPPINTNKKDCEV